MNRYNTNNTKVDIIFQHAQQYLKGKITIEKAKENIGLEMSNIRPTQYEEFKQMLVNVMRNSESDVLINELKEIFAAYIPFPFRELAIGHPLKNYYEENAYVRKLLIQVDEMENEEITVDKWLEIYNEMKKYIKHINRQTENFYSYIEKNNMSKEVVNARELGNQVIVDIEENIKNLNNSDIFNFLYRQRDYMIHLMKYLDLEERYLFPAAVLNLEDEDFINIKKLDDEVGYVFLEKIDEFIPADDKSKLKERISNNSDKSQSEESKLENLVFKNMLEIMDQVILLFDFDGKLIKTMGNVNKLIHLTEIPDVKNYVLSEEIIIDLSRNMNSVIRKHKAFYNNRFFDVVYSIVKEVDMYPKAILMAVNITANRLCGELEV